MMIRKEQVKMAAPSPLLPNNEQPPLYQGTDDEEYEDNFESIRTQSAQNMRTPQSAQAADSSAKADDANRTSLEPYIGKLERFELFSTNQCYYIVACDKHNIQYRVIKMDRTLIEFAQDETTQATESVAPSISTNNDPAFRRTDNQSDNASMADSEQGTQTQQNPTFDAAHRAKPTLRPLGDFLTEDPHTYSQREIQEMLDMIHFGNRYTKADGTAREGGKDGGGLKPLAKGYGIVGFIRFLDCYYLTLITRRAKVGSIGHNGIYTIKNVETFPLKPAERHHGYGEHDPLSDPSAMLLNMWNRGKRSVGLGLSNREIAELRYQGLFQVVDFTKEFYFSYTYDLTRSLQENFLVTKTQPFPPPPYKDMYAWNFFLTREFEDCVSSLTSYHWIMPLIHGAFVQRKLNDYGRTLNLTLVARRSRHFAGTRYLKRGVSEQGKVANDVEHEQILHDESNSLTGAFSSYLQVRGSIPVYWAQESSVTMPKPPIEINRVDPTYRATQDHFQDLMQRYGGPIVVLDLVKQSEKREREVRVGNEYRHAIDYINTSIDDPKHKIRYCALDYSHVSKHRHLDVSSSLNEVSTFAVNQTGFFCSSPRWKIMPGGRIIPFTEEDKKSAELLSERLGVVVFPMEQRGVLRTNCIDCLDRTNVAQFSAGVEALEQQMAVMGIRSSATLLPTANIIRCLIDMYVEIGDHISLQYGGSEAHKKVQSDRSEWHGPIGKHKELLTSVRRYYSNAFTDRLKQDAMNLLLGYYIPYRHTIPLWEMETDYYLHNLHVKSGKGMFHTMKSYQLAFGLEAGDTGDLDDKADEHDEPKLGHQSKIGRVRQRLEEQNESLSAWWKVAVQSNIQQRMWMQLGHDSEWPLPPRFDRIYQPNKLAQFDRFFARTWATPLRRSHNAQHRSDEVEEREILGYRKAVSGSAAKIRKSIEDPVTKSGGKLLSDFYTETGYRSVDKNSLELFVRHHSKGSAAGKRPLDKNRDRSFLGNLSGHDDPPEEYAHYVSSGESFSRKPLDADKVKEFENCLHETSLHSDDVAGICKLSESAHIGSSIRVGFYKGLEQNESALDVTTIIVEQFNALSSGSKIDEIGGMHLVDEELKRRGYHTVGVREAVARGWERTKVAQAEYAEICNQASNSTCRRSHLTTTESLGQYASFFDDATELSSHDLTYLNVAPKPKALESRQSETKVELESRMGRESGEFVTKAAAMGIGIKSYDDIVRARSAPLFNFEAGSEVRQGFEQINEDLFARKDNKFCVLNGAGMQAWKGIDPITNVTTSDSLDAFSSTHDTVSANRRH